MKYFNLFFILIFIATTSFSKAGELQKSQILENYGKIPLAFTSNNGQLDYQVKFTTRGNGAKMFFTQEGTTFLLSRETEESIAKRKQTLEKKNASIREHEPFNPMEERESEIEMEYYALKLKFINANSEPEIIGEERLPWNNNYFIGNYPTKWRIDVPNYAKIRLRNLYDGIDLLYYGNKNRIKYDFIIQPGADPAQIDLKYDFGNNPDQESTISINQKGELVVKTPFGNLKELKPYCYQVINGEKFTVDIDYKIVNKESNNFTFSISSYNYEYPLIIDPELVYSTYLGGYNSESGDGIAVDAYGSVYITGKTWSIDFPTTSGAHDESYNSNIDAFVSKLNQSGSALIYSTYIGGSEDDLGEGIAVDASGNAYITGATKSTDFPTTSGALAESFNGGVYDAFVSKLNSLGYALIFSTYLGGDNSDSGEGIAVDAAGSVYITGSTLSSDFPTTPGAQNGNLNGEKDAFVSKLNSSGSLLIYSTYLGGVYWDFGDGIAVDASGNAYITGTTLSTDFPTTSGTHDESFNGSEDVFVSKLNSSGSSIIYSTYIGGSYYDEGYGIEVDASGSVYITGTTYSSDFPTTSGALDESFNGGYYDAFVSKLNSSGSSLIYSTYLGGGDCDMGSDIALDATGSVYITGSTLSSDFPTTKDALDEIYNGHWDVFVSNLNSSGSALIYSTYLGGFDWDEGLSIAVDAAGSVYITGSTLSSDFPTTPGALHEYYNWNYDVFVSKIKFESVAIASISDQIFDVPFEIKITPQNFSGTVLFGANFNATFPSGPQVVEDGVIYTFSVTANEAKDNAVIRVFKAEDYSVLGSSDPFNIRAITGNDISPPANLNAVDNSNDQGGYVILQFEASPNHSGYTTVPNYKGDIIPIDYYQVYRSLSSALSDAVNWAVIPATPKASGQSDTISVVISTKGDISNNAYYWVAAVRGELPPSVSNSVSKLPVINKAYENKKQKFNYVYLVRNSKAVDDLNNGKIIISEIIGYNSAIGAKNTAGLTADFNSDLKVGLNDFAIFNWACGNIEEYDILFDLDLDGSVDLFDFSIFESQFGRKVSDKEQNIYNTGVNISSKFELISEVDLDKEQFEIQVIGKDLQSLAGYSFNLIYNSELYEFIDVYDEGFLESKGGNAPLFLKYTENLGCVSISNILRDIDKSTTPEGEGLIATFVLSRIGDRTEPISIEKVEIMDYNYNLNILNKSTLEQPVPMPTKFDLKNNYPNPFNPVTTIEYELPKTSFVTIKVYNTLGQAIETLVNENKQPGYYSVKWDGTNEFGVKVSSGIYIYRLVTNTGYGKTRKMVFLK